MIIVKTISPPTIVKFNISAVPCIPNTVRLVTTNQIISVAATSIWRRSIVLIEIHLSDIHSCEKKVCNDMLLPSAIQEKPLP